MYIVPGVVGAAVVAAADLSCHEGIPGERTPNEEVRAAGSGTEEVVGTVEEEGVERTGRRAMRRDLRDLSSVWRSARDWAWDEACFSSIYIGRG